MSRNHRPIQRRPGSAVSPRFLAVQDENRPPESSRPRKLSIEHLEHRTLLSVSVPGSIGGVAFYDVKGNGLTRR